MVTQSDLDSLYAGVEFDMADRYAQTLTTLFVTFFYSR